MEKAGSRFSNLLSHQFEKARELFLDQWLGFSEVELHRLLEDAGFREIEIRVSSRARKQSPFLQNRFRDRP